MVKEWMVKLSKNFKGIDCFLVAATAKAAHEKTLEDCKRIFIGIIGREMIDTNIINNEIAHAKEFNETDVKTIVVCYQKVGDYYQCKFKRNPALCLRFPVEMLDHPKKKRIGNTYWKVPTPIEDYLECTFNEDGTYKKVEV